MVIVSNGAEIAGGDGESEKRARSCASRASHKGLQPIATVACRYGEQGFIV